jgi:hypothetical protein
MDNNDTTKTGATWDDVKTGDTITVADVCTGTSFQVVVRLVARRIQGHAIVYGKRLTSKGKPSRMPTQGYSYLQEGERQEFIYIRDVTAIHKAA